MASNPDTGKRLILLIVSTLVSGLGAYFIWNHYRRPPANTPFKKIETRAGAETENLVRGGVCVADPVVGYRPRKGVVLRGAMGALGQPEIPVVRHQNNLSLIRDDDLVGELTGPRVLVHGDSHMMGILSTEDNAATVLEELLRKEPGLDATLVLNAGCDNYNFYQYVLRNRTLSERLKPDLILVVAYMGNDFVDLEDTRRPHLDDDGKEQPTSSNPPQETTTARLRQLALDKPGPLGGLFWQGLNQALYFQQRQDRLPFIEKKTIATLRLLQAEAISAKAELLIVMLPSFALVFPDKAKSVKNDKVSALIDSGAQQRFYDWFKATLATEKIELIDLLPALRKDGRQELYANDLHLWIPGHRLMAEALKERVAAILRKRR